MAEQIFYWTGCVIWWGLCLMVMGGMIAGVIITPIWAFGKSRAEWWKWVTLSRFADLGWSNRELKEILNAANITDESFFYTARAVIETGKKIKAGR